VKIILSVNFQRKSVKIIIIKNWTYQNGNYLGESASNLQKFFESIKDFPCVLLLDEFDIIGKPRDIGSSDVGEIHRIVNIFLGLLEEYIDEGIIIATTNLEGSIDKALFRRFDDFIEVPRPGKKEIDQLLKI
jgi:SpoVK/Ycf46/Vps4 family AAA+-type ATPase